MEPIRVAVGWWVVGRDVKVLKITIMNHQNILVLLLNKLVLILITMINQKKVVLEIIKIS